MSLSRSIKTVIAAFLILGSLIGPFSSYAYAQGPGIVGKAGVLIDSKSGKILYEKNADTPLPPASTTKILTVAVALEKGNLKDKVTISKNAASQEGSSIYLQEGEVLTLEELLWGILLNSGNDAAVAVAEHIAGSVPGFTRLMNEEAKAWGAKSSNFTNPNGLPDDKHFTTARDLAMIAKHAMENPKFREISRTKVKEINRQDPVSLSRLINHNKLLWRYEGANGIKTGYTRAAQQCLVSSAQKGDQEFIAVVLGSVGNNIWLDSKALLDYGFKGFHTRQLVTGNRFVQRVKVENGSTEARALTEKSLFYTSTAGEQSSLEEKVTIFKALVAPVEKGRKLGYLAYYKENTEVARVYLVAEKAVAEKVIVKRYPWIIPVLGIIFSILIAGFLGRKRSSRRRRRNLGNSYYRGPIR